ncbi:MULTISPECIES: hypothetical protein [Ralstonia]|jgi:hypothetical protein|nr:MULTISPECIES: hypothetical protein [Ralstonia]MCM3579420.1 hypothetical protein [Ralstonia pickettii]
MVNEPITIGTSTSQHEKCFTMIGVRNMRSTIEILDRARGSNSDYWIAKQVGSQPSVVSTWRKRGHVGPDAIVKLCEIAKVPVAKGLAICAWETITDKDLRARVQNAVSFKRPLRALKKMLRLAA